MKQLHSVLAVLMLSIFVISCSKKDVDPVPPFVPEGIYSGKIGTGSAIPSGQFELNLKKNGLLDRVSSNGEVSSTGTWELKGNAFTAHYKSLTSTVEVNLTGTLNQATKRISGTWKNSGDNDGTFYVVKK